MVISLALIYPKDGMLDHSIIQMHMISGFGDMLEDDIKMMHQILGRFHWQLSLLKSNMRRAESHAKMESMLHNKHVA